MFGSASESLSLSLCPSAPHRAVLGLFRLAMDLAAPEGLADDIRASDPAELAAIANNKIAHTFLVDGLRRDPEIAALLPRDLMVYFEAMQEDCIETNRQMVAVLEQIGTAFSEAGIKAVVLKGGAELLDPLGPVPCIRPCSDLDLLVGDEQMATAYEVLATLGGERVEVECKRNHDFSFLHHEVQYDTYHHDVPVRLPMLGGLEVELHRKFGNDPRVSALLSTKVALQNAVAQPSGLWTPDLATRLIHLICHAQVNHRLFERQKFKLRDVRDYRFMVARSPAEALSEVGMQFRAVGADDIFAAFTEISDVILGIGTSLAATTGQSRTWAKAALIRFAPEQPPVPQSPLLAGRTVVSWVANCLWRGLTSSEYRRYYLQVLLGQRSERGVFTRLRQRLSGEDNA